MRKIALLVCLFIIAACDQQEPVVLQVTATATLQPLVSRTPRYTATPVPTRTPLPTFTFTPTESPVPPTPTLSPTPTITPTVIGIVGGSRRVNIRSGPGTSEETVTSLPPGTGVMIVAQNPEGDWYQVQLDDGEVGWIASFLLFVEPTTTPFPTTTPSPDLTALFLGTPLPTTFFGGNTVTPTPPRAVRTPGTGEATAEVQPDATEPSGEPLFPVVDVQSLNLTATALVANAASATPSPTEDTRVIALASDTPAAAGENATAPPQDAPEQEPTGSNLTREEARLGAGVDVFAFCDNRAYGFAAPQNLAAGSTIDIFWAWFASTEAQVRDHVSAATIELRVNGELIENLGQYRTNIAPERGQFSTYWYVPYGPLDAGEYSITFRQSWSRQIQDGAAFYGPDTSIPFEEESCTFTVQ